LGFAEGNLWHEFKPDIKHFLRTKLFQHPAPGVTFPVTEPRP
jgi:hypothetical protein